MKCNDKLDEIFYQQQEDCQDDYNLLSTNSPRLTLMGKTNFSQNLDDELLEDQDGHQDTDLLRDYNLNDQLDIIDDYQCDLINNNNSAYPENRIDILCSNNFNDYDESQCDDNDDDDLLKSPVMPQLMSDEKLKTPHQHFQRFQAVAYDEWANSKPVSPFQSLNQKQSQNAQQDQKMPSWDDYIIDILLGEGAYGKVFKVYKKSDELLVKNQGKHQKVEMPTNHIDKKANYNNVSKTCKSDQLGNGSQKIIVSFGTALSNMAIKHVIMTKNNDTHVQGKPTPYVIKELYTDLMPKNAALQAMEEITILGQLDSPYVVGYIDSFVCEKKVNIIMEFCENGDLSTYLQQKQKEGFSQLPENQIWKFLIQICLGVNYLHQKGVARQLQDLTSPQKDFTPIQRSGNSKVQEIDQTTKVGTPYYLAPEIWQGKPYTEKSDMWSLGIILHELCTYQKPFNAEDLDELREKVLNQKYREIPERSNVPKQLQEIIKKLLRKSPSHRPSVKELLQFSSIRTKALQLKIDLPKLSPRKHQTNKSSFSKIEQYFQISNSNYQTNNSKHQKQESAIELQKMKLSKKQPTQDVSNNQVTNKLQRGVNSQSSSQNHLSTDCLTFRKMKQQPGFDSIDLTQKQENKQYQVNHQQPQIIEFSPDQKALREKYKYKYQGLRKVQLNGQRSLDNLGTMLGKMKKTSHNLNVKKSQQVSQNISQTSFNSVSSMSQPLIHYQNITKSYKKDEKHFKVELKPEAVISKPQKTGGALNEDQKLSKLANKSLEDSKTIKHLVGNASNRLMQKTKSTTFFRNQALTMRNSRNANAENNTIDNIFKSSASSQNLKSMLQQSIKTKDLKQPILQQKSKQSTTNFPNRVVVSQLATPVDNYNPIVMQSHPISTKNSTRIPDFKQQIKKSIENQLKSQLKGKSSSKIGGGSKTTTAAYQQALNSNQSTLKFVQNNKKSFTKGTTKVQNIQPQQEKQKQQQINFKPQVKDTKSKIGMGNNLAQQNGFSQGIKSARERCYSDKIYNYKPQFDIGAIFGKKPFQDISNEQNKMTQQTSPAKQNTQLNQSTNSDDDLLRDLQNSSSMLLQIPDEDDKFIPLKGKLFSSQIAEKISNKSPQKQQNPVVQSFQHQNDYSNINDCTKIQNFAEYMASQQQLIDVQQQTFTYQEEYEFERSQDNSQKRQDYNSGSSDEVAAELQAIKDEARLIDLRSIVKSNNLK
eukprot:403344133